MGRRMTVVGRDRPFRVGDTNGLTGWKAVIAGGHAEDRSAPMGVHRCIGSFGGGHPLKILRAVIQMIEWHSHHDRVLRSRRTHEQLAQCYGGEPSSGWHRYRIVTPLSTGITWPVTIAASSEAR